MWIDRLHLMKNESVIKKLPTNKNNGPDGFTNAFDETVQEELTTLLLNFNKFKRRLPSSYYEACIIPIPKPDRHYKKRKV